MSTQKPSKRVTPRRRPRPEFSTSTLNLFAGLLSQVSIPAGAPDFDAQVAVVKTARAELGAAMERAPFTVAADTTEDDGG